MKTLTIILTSLFLISCGEEVTSQSNLAKNSGNEATLTSECKLDFAKCEEYEGFRLLGDIDGVHSQTDDSEGATLNIVKNEDGDYELSISNADLDHDWIEGIVSAKYFSMKEVDHEGETYYTYTNEYNLSEDEDNQIIVNFIFGYDGYFNVVIKSRLQPELTFTGY